jgi:phytoene/squalene synthetase
LRELAIDLELFSRGGQEILNAIERQGFDVLRARPAISKSRKLMLALRAAAGKLLIPHHAQQRRVPGAR